MSGTMSLGTMSLLGHPASRPSLTFVALLLRLLASVLIVELSLRLLLPMPMLARYLGGSAGARIRAFGRGTPPPEARAIFDPLLGWTNGADGAIPIDGSIQHTTSQRLRGTRLYSREKLAGVLRIEVFGDSFAFGSEVDDGATYSAVLEGSLPRAEVLDFGVQGYGLDQALLRFRKEGTAFHPDVVVVGFVSVLSTRNTLTHTTYPKPHFVLRGRLELEGVPVPDLDEGLRAYTRSSRILDAWRMIRTPVDAPDPTLDRALLVEFVAEIRASGARPVIVSYPVPSEMGRESGSMRTYWEACVMTGATCVDTGPAFGAARARGVALSAPHGHFNAAGHRIVAGALADALAEAPR
jgi:hypothetical protein